MGLTDLFKRGRSNVVLGARQFTLSITGHGVSARPVLPASVAHLADGTLVIGPYDLPAAKASGTVRTVLVRAGTAPTRAFVKHAMSETSIVTYSTEERGTTQLVLGPGMQSYDDVLSAFGAVPSAPEMKRGDFTSTREGEWRVVTDNHEIVWPAGFTLRASGDLAGEHGAYELRLDGSPTNVIHLYGPLIGDKIPPPEALDAPGQSRIDASSLDGVVKAVKHYTFSARPRPAPASRARHASHGDDRDTRGESPAVFEGDATAQRYYYVHLDASAIYLVRARAALDVAKTVFEAADLVAASLRPRF